MKNIRKPNMTSILSLLFGLLVVGTLLSLISCSNSSRPQQNYIYSDPTSGKKVELRPSDKKAQEELETLKIELKNPIAQVLLKEKKISFWITRTMDGRSEDIEISGQLDDSLKSEMSDTKPINGKSRMAGLANCLKLDGETLNCSEMFIEITFYYHGEKITRQFIADPSENPIVAKIENEQVSAHTPTAKNDLRLPTIGNISSPPILSQAPTWSTTQTPAETSNETTSETTAPPVDTEIELNEENLANTTDGTYVTQKPSEKFYEKIEGYKPEVVQSNPTTIQDGLTFNLKDGGTAFRRYFTYYNKKTKLEGHILGNNTQLPDHGPGFSHVLSENKAYATGFTVSFLEATAARFAALHQECGNINIGNLSKVNGGELRFNKCEYVHGKKICAHASHQNGLEYDAAYLPHKALENVIIGKRVEKGFNYSCNYNLMKLLANIRLPNGKYAVHAMLVHPAIKMGLCTWAKASKLTGPEDKRTFKTLHNDANHNDHTHIRLSCSPEHEGCWEQPQLTDNLDNCI